jgi:hypothetical protein
MADRQNQSEGIRARATRTRRLRTNARPADGPATISDNLAANWFHRHQHPFNFWIHMVGIPLAVAGVVLLVVDWDAWWWGLSALVLGYTLQWLGHLVEGNDVGEWAAVKRMLGFEAVSISPRYRQVSPE